MKNPTAIKGTLLESFSRNEFATGEFKLKSVNKNVIGVQLIASPLITEDGERFYQLTLNDMAIRWGGDEFVLLLQAEDEESVKTAISKVSDGVKKPFYFNNETTPIVITMSVGVAFYPRMSRDINTLIKLADIAMY